MPAVRILLVGMSTIFSDIVIQALSRHTALEIVAQLEDCDELEATPGRGAPDLILRGLRADEREQEVGSRLLGLFPTATVVVFSSDHRHAFLHRMRPVRIPLNDVSLKCLLQAILSNPALRSGLDA